MTQRRALVTGGSGVIGSAIAERLAADGHAVILHAYRHVESAQRMAEKIKAHGGTASSASFDITDADVTRRTLDTLLKDGPIQIVVNNAGLHEDAPMARMTGEQWSRVIDLSLNGFFNVTQPLLLPMIGSRWGRIVSISSLAGVIGNRGQTNYAAAKAGLHGASKSLAIELASRGITVNVVAPGLIESPSIRNAFKPEQVEAMVPMKRAGTPEEVAALVSFLLSEQAGYITGQVIGVNGGMALSYPWMDWLWSHINYHEVHHRYPYISHVYLKEIFEATRGKDSYLVVHGFWRSLFNQMGRTYYGKPTDKTPLPDPYSS